LTLVRLQIWDTALPLGNKDFWASIGWQLRTLVLLFRIWTECLTLTYRSGSVLSRTTTLMQLMQIILLALRLRIYSRLRQKLMLMEKSLALLHGFPFLMLTLAVATTTTMEETTALAATIAVTIT
jgi:hypothetical protein